ncbi:MAG: helicase HerA domain-containing protein [Oscillospiraceae bacterium]
MIYTSKRKYYRNFLFAMMVIGALIIIGALVANKLIYHFEIVNKICIYALIIEIAIIVISFVVTLLKNKGIKQYISKIILLESIERNLISIGAYTKIDDRNYVELPKIKIQKGKATINLSNLKIRTIIERYLDSFSTALPERYIVEDYYITQTNSEVVILFEDIKNYKYEEYSIQEYKALVESMNTLDLYFDKKHIVSVNDYPHFLISGSSGSGKSYFANELVIQAIIKKWQVVICDLKRSYGLYRDFTDYVYELDDILEKLHFVESEMSQRMEKLQPELDKNPRALAVDIGYKPMLVVIEEYISLQASLDKKQKEELERVVKNLSVLARQSNIHLLIVMQSAGTENIQSTTRSNLTKVLLGNAQSNILTATFGNGVDVPNSHTKMNKGEGLIQLDRITILRVPKINDIENFKNVIS